MKTDYTLTETPFNYRQLCWFCGEPKEFLFGFPHKKWLVFDCVHPPLKVSACKECYRFASQVKVDNIWDVHTQVKQALIKHYHKDLAIGLNWTKQELEESEFDGGNFEGFKKSAWFMYEVAKSRVSFQPWAIVINGIVLESSTEKEVFVFDGMRYPSIDDAILHYVKVFDLNRNFFKQILARLGEDQFASAVRYARIHIGATPQEQAIILKDLN